MKSLFYGFGPVTDAAMTANRMATYQKQIEFLALIYGLKPAEVDNHLIKVAQYRKRLFSG